MGLLDSIESMAGGGTAGNGAHASVASAFFDAVGQHGGMSSVVDRFRQNGMAQHVDSWQQSGTPNQQISPDQAQQGLGSGLMNEISQKSGLSPTVVSGAMAVLMPMIVSHFAANGGTQSGGGNLMGMAQGFLSKL